MMNYLFLCSALFISFLSASAEEPEWVSRSGKSPAFPETQFLTGYGAASAGSGISKEQAEQSALENARKNLIEKISISITSVTTAKTEEAGDKYSSFFNSAVQSASNLDIQGLGSERYYNNNIAYAFVYVKREALQSTYQQKINSLKNELESKLKIAKSLETQNKATPALNEYLSCMPVVRRLEEAQTIFAFVKLSNTLTELEKSASANEITSASIREAISKLTQKPITSIDDLAWYLAFQLKEQVERKNQAAPAIFVTPLFFQDTKMGSSFSRYFNQVLEQKIGEAAQWNVVQANAPMILTGSYWEQPEKIKFIVTVRTVNEGKILASAEASVDAKVIASTGKNLKPENIQSALLDQKIFAQGESAGGGLSLEAWTNKQTQGNLFTENERMTVTVRVNMPCYLRFIYHMADGSRILLLNEYFIDQSKVNLAYQIPTEFECSPPFGSEVLQIFARTEKFEPVATKSIDGYDYLAEDLQKFVVKTRGMKQVKPNTMQAETRITITTMKE